MPTDHCDVHGDSVRTQLVKKFERASGRAPRSRSIRTRSLPSRCRVRRFSRKTIPTTPSARHSSRRRIADAGTHNEPGLDPDKPVKRAIPVDPSADGTIEVRRAQPVRPIDETAEPLIQTEPPAPLDFGDDH